MSVSVPSGSSEPHAPLPRRLHYLLQALACAALIAGCSSNNTETAAGDHGTIAWSQQGSGTTSTGPAPSGPPLDWQTRISGDTIIVEIRDPNDYYRVEQVELVGPDGVTIAASEINRETNRASGDTYRGWGGPTLGLGVGSWSGGGRSGTSTGVGLGFDFPIGGSSSASAPPTGTMTMASVRVPDLAHYRETVASWIVRVSFTDRNNELQTAVVPAPRPAG